MEGRRSNVKPSILRFVAGLTRIRITGTRIRMAPAPEMIVKRILGINLSVFIVLINKFIAVTRNHAPGSYIFNFLTEIKVIGPVQE